MRTGATIVFLDESGFSLIPFVRRTWAKKGTVPILRHSFGRWTKLSAISGVAIRLRRGTLHAELYYRTLRGAFAGADCTEFLRQLARHIRGPVRIVWDNAGQHRGPELRRFLQRNERFNVVPLPPYCPELNPDEGVWNWSKTKDMANLAAHDSHDLLRCVRRSLRRIQRRPEVLRWCLAESELGWDGLLNQRVGV